MYVRTNSKKNWQTTPIRTIYDAPGKLACSTNQALLDNSVICQKASKSLPWMKLKRPTFWELSRSSGFNSWTDNAVIAFSITMYSLRALFSCFWLRRNLINCKVSRQNGLFPIWVKGDRLQGFVLQLYCKLIMEHFFKVS